MSELKTCFKRVDYDLAGLLHYIDIGDIGLPDIQRPFVWSNAKVRDLFDSMYRDSRSVICCSGKTAARTELGISVLLGSNVPPRRVSLSTDSSG